MPALALLLAVASAAAPIEVVRPATFTTSSTQLGDVPGSFLPIDTDGGQLLLMRADLHVTSGTGELLVGPQGGGAWASTSVPVLTGNETFPFTSFDFSGEVPAGTVLHADVSAPFNGT